MKKYIVGITDRKFAPNKNAVKISLYDDAISFYDNCEANQSKPMLSKILEAENKKEAKKRFKECNE